MSPSTTRPFSAFVREEITAAMGWDWELSFWIMQDKEFYDLLLCYLATDSYDPEALKELLTGDPKLSAAFRANLKGLSSDENWSVAAASKDLNYGFRNSTDLGKWLLSLDSFLFGDGPVP